MNCAQVKEQLIDFLYGELPPATQTAFTEHLGGCSACKAEVASFERTLGSARAALGGPLLEEPPARVHLAVLEAAKAAAKSRTAAKAKPPTRRDELGNELGFLARLWRSPWFLPAFSAASVATVVFLVRVLKNPEVLPGQRPHSIEERTLTKPEPPSPSAAAPTAAPIAAPAAANVAETKGKLDEEAKAIGAFGDADKHVAKRVRAKAAPVDVAKPAADEPQGLGGMRLGKGRAGEGASNRFAEPPPPRQVGAKKSSKSLDDLLSAPMEPRSEQRRAQPPAPAAIEQTGRGNKDEDRFDGLSGTLGGPALRAPEPEPATKVAKPTARSVTHSASAPAGAAAPAYAPAPATAPAVQPLRDYPAKSAASAPAPSAPPPSLGRKKMKREEETAEKSVVPDSDEEAAEVASDGWTKEAKDKKAGEKAGPSLDESVRKADRLYASQDWNAAAAAYRDLLNRFPSHKDASRWRDRMNESNIAYQRTLEAKRKKTMTEDPLSGSKR